MKITLLITMIFVLCGCESVGDIIREKKYTLQIHEMPYSRQTFGYNTDYDYVGFMINGSFGSVGKHTHTDNCSHSLENIFK